MKKAATATRTCKEYVDWGFGFPVLIKNVRVALLGDEEVPLIDYRALEQEVICALPSKTSRLTGHEVRFIRQHFKMSLVDFGKRFGVTHAAVKKWEGRKEEPTGMAWSTEKDIRLFILEHLRKAPREFVSCYRSLESMLPERSHRFSVNYETVAGSGMFATF